MADTFTPPINPSVGMSRKVTPRVLSAAFGDGYRQEAGDGLNAIPRSLSLAWDMLLPTDADLIEAFFIAQKGYVAFLWTDPSETVQRQWKCSTWSRTSPTGVTESMSATFDQVFDL